MIDGRVAHSVLLEVFTPEGVGTMVLPGTPPVLIGRAMPSSPDLLP